LKAELWPKVKEGDYLIYADEYDGVFKAKVIETDITIETYEPEYRREQPYGLTAETGYVKIKYNEKELIENLANLIRFVDAWYRRLKKIWDEYQQKKSEAEDELDAFTELRAELREK